MPWKNKLYYGDNLEVLRHHVGDETVDLIYLDPPFNSNATYNVLFAEQDGSQAAAQIQAFEDSWRWDQQSAASFEETVERGGPVAEAMVALRSLLGGSNMLAYLSMMAPRLAALHRALRPTGSLYLHCDSTASPYLRILLDSVFGPRNFRNEITWKRTSAHSDTKQGMRRYGRVTDTMLFFTKTDNYTWNPQYTPYAPGYLDSEYRHVAPDGRRYKEADLTAAKPGGDTEYIWHVVKDAGDPHARWQADLAEEYRHPQNNREYKEVTPYHGRYWAYSYANMVQFAKERRLVHRKTGMPRLMLIADEMPGVALQDLWDDIPPTAGAEDLGYPTQKPGLLLERIIKASSSPDDLVLDPFCGCGTAICAAHELSRRWIGIDITHLAVALMRHRLRSAFGKEIQEQYEVLGEPKALPDAETLASTDPYQFQWWALGLVGARPIEQKKGADKGIDGRIYFHDEKSGQTKQIILSVKAGRPHVTHVRDLRGVMQRENADIGVLISMHKPTSAMAQEAASAGFYQSELWDTKHPRLQIITVEKLLSGASIDYPYRHRNITYRAAQKSEAKDRPKSEQLTIEAAEDSPAYDD